jgi:uncharacterized membrane protein
MNRAVANAIALAGIVWGFGFGLSVALQLPARVGVHFTVDGTPDRFGSNLEAGLMLLMLPAVALLLNLLFVFLPRFDAKAAQQSKVLDLIRVAATLLLVFLQFAVAQAMQAQPFDLRLVIIAVGVFLIVVGNVMPKIPPNRFAGVRLPYTFASRQSWWATNRAGGWLLVILGALLVVSAAVLPQAAVLYALLAVPIVSTAGLVRLTLLAKREWQRDSERQPLG